MEAMVKPDEPGPPDVVPLTAAPGLMEMVVRQAARGRNRGRRSQHAVTPEIQLNPHPNRYTPRGRARWIAHCPECPGAEVVPAEGLFVCGSCGAEAEVDWTNKVDG